MRLLTVEMRCAVGHTRRKNDRRAVETHDAEFEMAVRTERAAHPQPERLPAARQRDDQTVAEPDSLAASSRCRPSGRSPIATRASRSALPARSLQLRYIDLKRPAGIEAHLNCPSAKVKSPPMRALAFSTCGAAAASSTR